MTEDSAALRQRIEALRDRISNLTGAILRISESLDPDTVLQEILDSARALTGAAPGAITTVDEEGRPLRFLSSGITPDYHGQLAAWSDGPKMFRHLVNHPGT